MWELQLWNFLLPIPISIYNTKIIAVVPTFFSFTVKYRFVRVPTD
ncbi:hypothetical protein LEP1GSC105_3903 [Leptospira interrogans str. UI 12758]|uniref:Uncharacterized protein n=1 Tax=Leptospira interrogans str. UI 12758 TaxID=1049938 RepID=A0A0E2DH02_LEPIR|nr:hypothetical protein LEP1GSC105_3903 [Leptospira interrogans str. UI 12758]